MKISEVLQQPAGTIIDHVVGDLIDVGRHEDHVRPDGTPYTSQSFVLREAQSSGPTITGVAYDHYPLDMRLNDNIVLTSMKSRNHRFGGVTVAGGIPVSIFNRKASPVVLRVSKVGVFHSPETFKLLNRPE